jgi:hypothetical protein
LPTANPSAPKPETPAPPTTNQPSVAHPTDTCDVPPLCAFFPAPDLPSDSPSSPSNGSQVLGPDTLSQTPEVDSLALLGTGLLGFGGYAVTRWRARRR